MKSSLAVDVLADTSTLTMCKCSVGWTTDGNTQNRTMRPHSGCTALSCATDDCSLPIRAKGLYSKRYVRLLRTGLGACSVDGCSKRIAAVELSYRVRAWDACAI